MVLRSTSILSETKMNVFNSVQLVEIGYKLNMVVYIIIYIKKKNTMLQIGVVDLYHHIYHLDKDKYHYIISMQMEIIYTKIMKTKYISR